VRTLLTTQRAPLHTYVGAETSRRVLAGLLRRGEVETLEAAFMLCDLRGFTELSNRLPSGRVLELLNSYFDCIVPAINEAGGEVIKFMGDSVLALFSSRERLEVLRRMPAWRVEGVGESAATHNP